MIPRFSHSPADDRSCQMEQRLEIVCSLFVSHSQLPEVVHPRVRSLDDPAPGSPLGLKPTGSRSLSRHVRDVTPRPHFLLGGFAAVAFIHAEVLRFAGRWLRPMDHNRVQRLRQQLHVVPIGPGDDKRERGATAVHQQAALGPFFFPGQWGYCPRPPVPAAPCPGFHPNFATPKQCLPSRRTPPTPPATIAQKLPGAATAESGCESNWRFRTPWGEPSIGNPCAAHTRRPRKCHGAKWACARRRVAVGICASGPHVDFASAAAVRLVPTVHRKLPKIALSPCRELARTQQWRQLLFTDKL